MALPQEFHYRLPGRASGQRPGAHPASTMGVGQEFIAHRSLYDWPDPRRLDLRASLRSLRGDWLVRVHRQRVGVPVYAIVDVSKSMLFGVPRSKLLVAAEFLESLGLSAFRMGDAVGLIAFDSRERPDLYIPARVGRGLGTIMAGAVKSCASSPEVMERPRAPKRFGAIDRQGASHGPGTIDASGSIDGLVEATSRLAGRQALIFLVSDFHWPLERLGRVLESLAHAFVVPLILWSRAEVEPPAANALASIRDLESGAQRTLWLRPKTRDAWRQAVAQRREDLGAILASRNIRPLYLLDSFDSDSLTHYFFGGTE